MPRPRRGQVGVSTQTSYVSVHLISEPVLKAVGDWLDPPIPFVAMNMDARKCILCILSQQLPAFPVATARIPVLGKPQTPRLS